MLADILSRAPVEGDAAELALHALHAEGRAAARARRVELVRRVIDVGVLLLHRALREGLEHAGAAEGVVEEHVRGTLYRVRFSNNETTVMPRSSLVTKILQ